jgi:hypothetical protein
MPKSLRSKIIDRIYRILMITLFSLFPEERWKPKSITVVF